MNFTSIMAFALGAIISNDEYRKIALDIGDKLIKNGIDGANSLMKNDAIKGVVENALPIVKSKPDKVD